MLGDDEDSVRTWKVITIFLYAIFVAFGTAVVPYFSNCIVRRQNLGTDSEQEEARMKSEVLLTSIISYSGLFFFAYFERNYALLNWLMLFMYIIQKVFVSLFNYWSPHRNLPRLFKSSAKRFKPHFRKFADDYELFSSRQLHIDAEQ